MEGPKSSVLSFPGEAARAGFTAQAATDVALPFADGPYAERAEDPPPASHPGNGAVARQWNRDPVAFARHIGVELTRKERQVLRSAMKGQVTSKHRRGVLETVRQKIEAGLRRASEQSSAAVPGEAEAPAPLDVAESEES